MDGVNTRSKSKRIMEDNSRVPIETRVAQEQDLPSTVRKLDISGTSSKSTRHNNGGAQDPPNTSARLSISPKERSTHYADGSVDETALPNSPNAPFNLSFRRQKELNEDQRQTNNTPNESLARIASDIDKYMKRGESQSAKDAATPRINDTKKWETNYNQDNYIQGKSAGQDTWASELDNDRGHGAHHKDHVNSSTSAPARQRQNTSFSPPNYNSDKLREQLDFNKRMLQLCKDEHAHRAAQRQQANDLVNQQYQLLQQWIQQSYPKSNLPAIRTVIADYLDERKDAGPEFTRYYELHDVFTEWDQLTSSSIEEIMNLEHEVKELSLMFGENSPTHAYGFPPELETDITAVVQNWRMREMHNASSTARKLELNFSQHRKILSPGTIHQNLKKSRDESRKDVKSNSSSPSTTSVGDTEESECNRNALPECKMSVQLLRKFLSKPLENTLGYSSITTSILQNLSETLELCETIESELRDEMRAFNRGYTTEYVHNNLFYATVYHMELEGEICRSGVMIKAFNSILLDLVDLMTVNKHGHVTRHKEAERLLIHLYQSAGYNHLLNIIVRVQKQYERWKHALKHSASVTRDDSYEADDDEDDKDNDKTRKKRNLYFRGDINRLNRLHNSIPPNNSSHSTSHSDYYDVDDCGNVDNEDDIFNLSPARRGKTAQQYKTEQYKTEQYKSNNPTGSSKFKSHNPTGSSTLPNMALLVPYSEYYKAIQHIQQEQTHWITPISQMIDEQYGKWWNEHKQKLSPELGRLVDQLTWASWRVGEKVGSRTTMHDIPLLQDDKIDVHNFTYSLKTDIENQHWGPKMAFGIITSANMFPEPCRTIIRAEVRAEQAGHFWDKDRDKESTEIVYWSVMLRKAIIRVIELIGHIPLDAASTRKLNDWKVNALTSSLVMQDIRAMFSTVLGMDKSMRTFVLFKGWILKGLEKGSPAAKDFAEKLKMQMTINRPTLALAQSDDDKIKIIMSLAEVVYSDLIDSDAQYQNTTVTTKKTNAAYNTNNFSKDRARSQSPGSDQSVNQHTQQHQIITCDTCGLREHRKYIRETGVRGPCQYWLPDMSGPDIVGIAHAEFKGKRVILLLNKFSDRYKAWDNDAKIEIEAAVARLVSTMEKHHATLKIDKPPPINGTKVGRTSAVIRTVRELLPITASKDSLTVIEGRVLHNPNGEKPIQIPVMMQADGGSEATLISLPYAKFCQANIVDRNVEDYMGVVGVGSNNTIHWIKQDAELTITFNTHMRGSFDKDSGQPIPTGKPKLFTVKMKFGIHPDLGIPCILGSDTMESLKCTTYMNPDVMLMEAKHILPTYRMQAAVQKAKSYNYGHWDKALQEATYQSSRISRVSFVNRVTIPPRTSIQVPVQGQGFEKADDVSEVIIKETRNKGRISGDTKAAQKFTVSTWQPGMQDGLKVFGGPVMGRPYITLINTSTTEVMTSYVGAITVEIVPKILQSSFIREEAIIEEGGVAATTMDHENRSEEDDPQTKTTTESRKRVRFNKPIATVRRVVRVSRIKGLTVDESTLAKLRECIPMVPHVLWKLINPNKLSDITARYAKFDHIRQIEIVTELLKNADIFESDKITDLPWVESAMEEVYIEIENFKMWDPGTDIDEKTRTNYTSAVQAWRETMEKTGINTERMTLLAQLLAVPDAIFHPDPDNPALARGEQCKIVINDLRPIICRPRRFSWFQKAFLEAKTSIMIKQGKLEECEGDFASALVLVAYDERIKKSMERWGDRAEEEAKDPRNALEVASWYRMCCDFRELNNRTIAEAFPLPRIDDLLDEIKPGTTYFTSGDVADAFFCIELEKDSRKYTGFRTHNQHLQFRVMPQGGKNCAARFSRIIDRMFKKIDNNKAVKYMDDILVHSSTFEEHLTTLDEVYQCLIDNQLTFKLSKLHIGYDKIKFLGHMISGTGRFPDPESTAAIQKLAYPSDSQTSVRSFLGSTTYYKDYIPAYSTMVAPLYDLTRKGVDVPEEWKKNQQKYEDCVDEIKLALISAPCLRMPDNSRKFRLVVDACRVGRGLGAILQQLYDDGWHPVSYWSKSLSPTERNYTVTELECKAMHDAMLRFDVYLRHTRFEVITDHNALTYLVKAQTAHNNGRLMRYLMDMQPYDFEATYRKGDLNSDADAISRLLQKGEVVEYLTTDELRVDRGTVSDEEFRAASQVNDAKQKLIERLIRLKKEAQEKKKHKLIQKSFEESISEPEEPIIGYAKIANRCYLVNRINTTTISNECVEKILKTCLVTRKIKTSNSKKFADEEETTVQRADENANHHKIANHHPRSEKKKRAKQRIEEQNKIRWKEKYKFNNDMQSPKLAEEMSTLLTGKKYIDDEDGKLYEVTSIVYDREYQRVIGFRKNLEGSTSPYDDDPFEVFGEMGLYQLVDMYSVDNNLENQKWPGNDQKLMSRLQDEDEELSQIKIKLKDTTDKQMIIDDINYQLIGEHDTLAKIDELHHKGPTIGYIREIPQIVVPKSIQKVCMEVIHDGMGHPGSTRCLATTKLRYYWKYMRRDISQYVSECQFCKIRKSYFCKPSVPIQEYPEVNLPMERIHMDLTGVLPTTEGEGNKYILVIKDFKTKYVWLYPIKDKNATTVAQIILNDLIPFWGAPELIVTDKGTEFKNKLLKEITELFSIEKINTTPSNPRANGTVEKHNTTMKDMLYNFTNERHNNWDQSVKLVAMLYNSTVNVSTGYTPYYLMFGREMNMVDDIKIHTSKDNGEYVENICEALSLAWEITTEREHYVATRYQRDQNNKNKMVELFTTIKRGDLEKIQSEASQLQHIIKRKYEFREYEVGDKFYRKRHPVRAFKSAGEKEKWKISMKLQSRYQGPYVISERINAVLYEAIINGVKCRVHAVNMKPARNRKMDIKIENKNKSKQNKIKIVSCLHHRGEAVGGTTGKKKPVSLKSYAEIVNDVIDVNQNTSDILYNHADAIREVVNSNKGRTLENTNDISTEQIWKEMNEHSYVDEDGETIIGPWTQDDMTRWGLTKY